MSAPMSVINICTGVKLDNRYQHSIYFDSRADQRKYFEGYVVTTFPSYSYHRTNWELKVEATVEFARNWSYLFIDNPGEETEYYFINKVEYVSDTTVKLHLELDVIQTYLINNENNLLPCFVERQHTPTDEIGEHTVPEGLELGSYWNYHTANIDDLGAMGVLVMSALDLTQSVTESTPTAYGRQFNGVYSGLGVYAFNDISKLELQLQRLDTIGKPDAIVGIWMYPRGMIRLVDSESPAILRWWDEFAWENNICAEVDSCQYDSFTLKKFDNYKDNLFEGYGYSVRNKKLFTAPYNLMYVTTNQGDSAEYKFEHFDTSTGLYRFKLYGAISPDAGVKLAPDKYNIVGNNANYEEGITMGNFPPCAWDSDTYKVWLAQNYNQTNHGVQSAIAGGVMGLGMAIGGAVATAVTGGLGAVAGVGAIAGGVSAVYGAYNQISGIMAQKEDAKAQPPQAKGTFSSSVNVANDRQTFTFFYKCVRKEYARQIDDYFTMFGYRLNRVQKPNINARPGFTYVKTIGCKMEAFINQEYVTAIENIFDAGITFWKDGNKICDYDQYNSV